jgi:hypothetical protein
MDARAADAWSLSVDAERALGRRCLARGGAALRLRRARELRRRGRRARDAGGVRQLQLERAAESSARWLELAPTSEVARRYPRDDDAAPL